MANILQILGAAGKGLEGYGIDRENRVKSALASRKTSEEERRNKFTETLATQNQARDTERDRVLNALTTAQTARLGRPDTSLHMTDQGLARVEDEGPPGLVKVPDVSGPLTRPKTDPTARYTFPVGADPSGTPQIMRGNTLTGELKPTGTMGRMNTAKPPTEAQEKSHLFYNLMKNAEPGILRAHGSGKVRPEAVTTYLNSMDVPLLGRAAKPLINSQLNADEQQLIRDAKDFTSGVLRKETGAAYSATEILDTMERYFPGMFGDKPELTKDKARARAEYMATMADQAAPALLYYEMRKGAKAPAGGDAPKPASPLDHSAMSDEDFAKAYRAGQFRTP